MLNIEILGTFSPVQDNLIMGVSDVNDYVPVYVWKQGRVVTKNSFTYFKPKFYSSHITVKNVPDFCYYLSQGGPINYTFRKGAIRHQLFGFGGNIIDIRNNFLLVFTIKSSTLTVDYSNLNVIIPYNSSREVNPEHLKLFVSTEFMSNPVYSTVYKRIYQEIILPCLEKGVEVSYLLHGEIDRKLFNDGLNRNFETITDTMNYLSPEVTERIYNYLTPLEMASFVDVAEEVGDDDRPF